VTRLSAVIVAVGVGEGSDVTVGAAFAAFVVVGATRKPLVAVADGLARTRVALAAGFDVVDSVAGAVLVGSSALAPEGTVAVALEDVGLGRTVCVGNTRITGVLVGSGVDVSVIAAASSTVAASCVAVTCDSLGEGRGKAHELAASAITKRTNSMHGILQTRLCLMGTPPLYLARCKPNVTCLCYDTTNG